MTDDLDRIMAIMEAAFDPEWNEAWTRKQVSDSLAFTNTHYRLVDADRAIPARGEAVGFSLVRAVADEEELLLIAVDPAMRGRGLGRALIEDALQQARQRGSAKLFLEMRDNNPAQSLYRNCQFEPIGRRREYYRTRSGPKRDAITFARTID
ncbi:ribosomal protein S18-alanine N-acetyltransferase [Qipengyuania sp. JC766]|uniref:ribosomal protein S18-alanine N-acetyltransferase n=1 Tax=Qipengyuania sp. JC766 TaxID=3232139 RepID=UPI003458DA30